MRVLYCYACPKCGRKVDEFRNLAERNAPVTCEAKTRTASCDGVLVRDFQAELPAHNAVARDWTSFNSGVMPSQVPEANREYADLGVTFCPQTGNARVPGKTRQKFLKRRGFTELSSAPRRPRRVSA
jgi:hypothetical protein